MDKKVKEIMTTDLITIGWNEPMETAHQRMLSNGIRHLPVTDDRGVVIGIVSDRDVSRAMQESQDAVEFDPEARVRDFMSWPVRALPRSSSLKQVTQLMVEDKISSLLVTDSNRVVGIVTSEDLLRVLLDLLDQRGPPMLWSLDTLLGKSSSSYVL